MSWRRRKYSEPPVPRNSSRLAIVPGSAVKPSSAKRGARRSSSSARDSIVQVRAVEPAVDLRELVVHVADLEVAPLAVVLAVPDLHVELAERRRHLLDGAVVAERREVIVGIDAAEQRVRRLVQEVAEEILERLVARVGARREPPAVAELAVHVEREPRVGRRVEVVRRVLALQQLDRAVRVVAATA